MGIRFLGVGKYLPPTIVRNEDISSSPDWVRKNLGMNERHIEYVLETSDMAVCAAQNALASAKLEAKDIDVIILATSTPDMMIPSTASIVQGKLGAKNAFAFDVSAVCSGFVYALYLAKNILENDSCKKILVIASEKYSMITDWNDRNCVYFADGAGAVIVENNSARFVSHLYTNGEFSNYFTTKRANDKFKMKGRKIHESAVDAVSRSIESYFREDIDNIKWVIPHQPNIHILREISKKTNIPFTKFVVTLDKFGNTAGATIPMALDVIKDQINDGDLILMAAVGAGMTGGTILIEWKS
jgi:3-oxoacyl-[acyl-carrier-protein] synthase-3